MVHYPSADYTDHHEVKNCMIHFVAVLSTNNFEKL